MEEKTTREISEIDRQALKQHRLVNAINTLQNIESRNTAQKIRSKKKRRAKEKQARKSRKANR